MNRIRPQKLRVCLRSRPSGLSICHYLVRNDIGEGPPLTISTSKIRISWCLENQIDALLPRLYLLASSIDLCELRHICLYEFNLAILVQSFALLDNSVCGRLVPSYEVNARGDCMLDEGFESELSNTACTTNCSLLADAQLI